MKSFPRYFSADLSYILLVKTGYMSTPSAREAGKMTRWPGRKRLEMEWALPDMAV